MPSFTTVLLHPSTWARAKRRSQQYPRQRSPSTLLLAVYFSRQSRASIERSSCSFQITLIEMANRVGRQRTLGIWQQTKRVVHQVWTLGKNFAKQVREWIQRLASNEYVLLTAKFSAAVALAVGHHLFYASKAGTAPPSGDGQLDGVLQIVSGQSINIIIGTLFAAVATALLNGCIATSHQQLSWKAARAKPAKLGLLDNLFSRKLWPPRLWLRWRYLWPELFALISLYVYSPFWGPLLASNSYQPLDFYTL